MDADRKVILTSIDNVLSAMRDKQKDYYETLAA